MSNERNHRKMSDRSDMTKNTEHEKRKYQRPAVVTYDAARIIQEIGPAFGVYGDAPGEDGWSL